MVILVVDDDPDFLDLLRQEMGMIKNVRIDIAHDPVEAVKMLAEHNYELIVSDWQLEGTTGPEVVRLADDLRHRSTFRGTRAKVRTPVIFMSGSDKTEQTRALANLQDYEPVSFMLKSCGAAIIRVLAETIVTRFRPTTLAASC